MQREKVIGMQREQEALEQQDAMEFEYPEPVVEMPKESKPAKLNADNLSQLS